MAHLIEFRCEQPAPPARVEAELRRVLSTWLADLSTSMQVLTELGSATQLKRTRVTLSPIEGLGHLRCAPERDEPIGELLNVLATVQRTADALGWLAETPGIMVHKCNPTTSDDGHDIEAVQDGCRRWVEVSDVAGRGNANGKMTADLHTLLTAFREAEGPAPKLFLAVSSSSAGWLTNPRTTAVRRLGAVCVPVAEVGLPSDRTHVVEVRPLAGPRSRLG